MTTYRITWRCLAPYSTALQSDTIFGHICWAIRYLYGDVRLTKILEALASDPGCVCSNAFPVSKLPVPLLSLPKNYLKKWQSLIGKETPDAEKEWITNHKILKEASLVSLEDLLSGDFDLMRFLFHRYEEKARKNKTSIKKDKQLVFHNTINRVTGTTEKDTASLYAEEVSYIDPYGIAGDVESIPVQESYLDCDDSLLSSVELDQIFEYISISGFGKNKSTGRGHYLISMEKYDWLIPEVPNACLLLSNMVPDETDAAEISYRGFTKYGKLGGSMAQSESPFKKPIFMFSPGSVIWSNEKPRGRMVMGIHPDNEMIVQNLYAYSIPISVKREA